MSGYKGFALVVALAVCVVYAADQKSPAKPAVDHPKTYRRLIPADVLRDFPTVCFASTRCSTIEVGQTWELTPFCGRSTCVKAEGDDSTLLELVEDCGPLPKANPKCKLSDKVNKTAPFPDCCPSFDCEPGVKLEYPDLPVAPADGPSTTGKPTGKQ
jgi:hypothetical protein